MQILIFKREEEEEKTWIGKLRKELFCCSGAQFCPTLCDPMDCSTPSFPAFTISWSLLKRISVKSVMPSNHLIPCHPLLLLPSIFPSIRVFSNESVLHIRWPKYWSFRFSISLSNDYSGLWFPLGLTGLISFQSKGLSRVFSNTTVQKHQLCFLASPKLPKDRGSFVRDRTLFIWLLSWVL